MTLAQTLPRAVHVFLVFLFAVTRVPAKDEGIASAGWLPISPEELAMKDNPADPGAPAMILYREESTDGARGYELHYYRIKIFTEQGKRYANVGIKFSRDGPRIEEIEGRTVHQDGKIVEFDGTVYEGVLGKAKDVQYLAKTFTLPDVQVGDIIEYKYKWRWTTMSHVASMSYWRYRYLERLGSFAVDSWTIDENLFTRRAHFFFAPALGARVMWTWDHLPGNKVPQQQKGGTVELDVENIAAFPEEEEMPPEDELKGHVYFFYLFRPPEKGEQNPSDSYWKEVGKSLSKEVEKFMGKRKALERTVGETAEAGAPAETRLRKLYARAQQVRNLTYEPEKTEKEEKREKLREAENVEDVLKHGYGSSDQINMLFVALARAAGFGANLVVAAPRSRGAFRRNVLNKRQLSSDLVEIPTGSQHLFLNPGVRFCPFGLLPWEETDVPAMRLEEKSGVFETTAAPLSSEAVLERKASLQLDGEGGVRARIQVSFKGREALKRRVENRDEDQAGRRKALEDEVKGWLPAEAKVELQRAAPWDDGEQPLSAEFTIQIPNFATSTGRRLLLPVAVFAAKEKNTFQHLHRTHPVYFRYPYQQVDELTFELPGGYQAESLPASQHVTPGFGSYDVTCQNQEHAVRCERRLVMDGYFFPVERYSALVLFFNNVRKGDEGQIVLHQADTASTR